MAMKRVAMVFGAAGLAFAQPALAQDTLPDSSGLDFSGMAAAMGEVFKAEPLTPEQETRLPQAEAVVGQLFPPGTYRKMMDQMMGPMMDGIMSQIGQLPVADIARISGLDEAALAGIGDARLGEIAALLDPAFEERNRITGQVSVDMVTRLMDRIEPSYRAGLARAFATRFSSGELGELQQFFATPVGGRYAAESMLIYADPQVMAAMNEMMPAMFEMMPGMIEEMQTKTAHLPPARTAADLSDSELARLARLLGVPPGELKARAAPPQEEAAGEAW